jgi:ligand-binding sensor domain-containing protein
MKGDAMKRSCTIALVLVAGMAALGAPPASSTKQGLVQPQMPRFRFENFTTANGLPNDHVYAVLVDGDRIWAGTDNGLALYENHTWKTYSTNDGLAHRAVLSLALDKRTGDVWAGTMGGLSRISGGRIDSFTQLNSGLSNDVVYGVSIEGENVWIATAAGACRLNLHTNQWSLYNERNTPMFEIWSYSVSATPTKVYYGIWGSGVLEYDQKTGKWDKYDDPDGENEIVLFKDQGLIHEIVTSVSYVDNVLWAATYFGDSQYDGRYWHNFLKRDSGLPSNFTNVVKGVDGKRAWFGTDKGLAYYDGVNWVVYCPSLKDGKPEMTVRDADGNVTPVEVATAPAHNYILGIDFAGDDIWVATAKGLSHGIREKNQWPKEPRK